MIKNTLDNTIMPDHLTSSGGGLSVLICTAYKHHFNWMTYSNWYSLNRILPDAKVAITCSRTSKIETYLYHWVYKCNDLRYNLHKNINENLSYLNKIFGVFFALKMGLVKQPLIVLDADMMALRELSNEVLKKLSSSTFATVPCPYKLDFSGKPVGPIWYFNGISLEKIGQVINTIRKLKGDSHLDLLALSEVFGDEIEILDELGNEVADNGITTFTHYGNGCGNYTRSDWEKGKTVPPFEVSYALQSSSMSSNEKKVLALWGQMANLWGAINQIKI